MTVSIIVAAYNVGSLITRAIDSVRAQTVGDWEIVVVDDCSTDNTAEVVAGHAATEARIRLIRQPVNGGPAAARNRGIAEARGEWVAILDADDAWRPERLERLLAVARSNAWDFVADNLILFDDTLGREVGRAFRHDAAVILTPERFFSDPDLRQLGWLKPMMSRAHLLGQPIRYDEGMRAAEDFLLYCELILSGTRAVLVPEAYYVYTTPVGGLSRQRASGTRSPNAASFMLRISDRLTERYGAQFTPAVRRGVEGLRRNAVRRWISSEITRLRGTRNLGALVVFLIKHPTGAFRYAITSRTFGRQARRGETA